MVSKEISASKQLSYEVDIPIVLQEAKVLQLRDKLQLPYHKRVTHLLEDVFFVLDVIDVLALDDLALFHGFYSIFLTFVGL